MIPQAGSAYAYSYATLGELVAWIIGWDLILEYAVGNVAVAISWGDYFNTLLRGLGISLPVVADDRLPHGAAQLGSRDPRAAANGAAHRRAFRSSSTCRRSAIVMLITWLLLQGAKESATRQQHHGRDQAARARRCSSPSARRIIHPANYHPFAPNGFTGIHQGAAIVFFAYIGFDAISTAAEETNNPQRNLPIGILGGLAICTRHLRDRRRRAHGHGAVHRAGGRRSARARAAACRLQRGRLDRRARRGGLDVGGAARVPVRPAAHLLLRWRATACCRSGRREIHPRTRDSVHDDALTGIFVARASLDRRRRRRPTT